MFDNLATAIVQALGFFIVLSYFVYQLLSDDKKSINNQSIAPKKKSNDFKEKIDKPRKKGLFGRKIETVKEEIKPKKKGWFN